MAMNAIEMLRNRRAAITAGLDDLIADTDGLDLGRPVMPGTSPLGLTLWHIPRTQDWLVNTCLRDVEEVAGRFGAGLPDPERFGFGTGLAPDDAQRAAAAVTRGRLRDYAAAVGHEVDAWLATLDEAALDVVPPFQQRQAARAAYTTPGALEAIDGLDGLSVGMLLLRPGLAHLLRHLGEIETLSQLARAPGS
jgi:hypothetical protein